MREAAKIVLLEEHWLEASRVGAGGVKRKARLHFALLVSPSALVRSDFELVAADIHAAPAAGAFPAGVEEMKNARFALAEAGRLVGGEEIGCGFGDGKPEVRGCTRVENRFADDLPVSPVE